MGGVMSLTIDVGTVVHSILEKWPDVKIRTGIVAAGVFIDVTNGTYGAAIEVRRNDHSDVRYGLSSLPTDSIGAEADENYHSVEGLMVRLGEVLAGAKTTRSDHAQSTRTGP